MSIQVKNIHKQFGDFIALDNISLDFPSGELVALLSSIRLWQNLTFAHHRRFGHARCRAGNFGG